MPSFPRLREQDLSPRVHAGTEIQLLEAQSQQGPPTMPLSLPDHVSPLGLLQGEEGTLAALHLHGILQ